MSRKLALIIGNSEYQDTTLARLVTPYQDVTGLTEVLQAPEIGGFHEVTTLINKSSTTIRLEVESFFAEKKPDDLLMLYFSGHGIRDHQGQLYLAVKDTRHNRLRATAIPAAFITESMDHSRSRRQVLILDCCHSGAFAYGIKGMRGVRVGTATVFEGNGYGRVVLTATDSTQYAWEGDEVIGRAEKSVFTHYLIEGLRTGEADRDGDGKIALDELYDYVYEQVVSRTPKQMPGKWSYKQQGEIVIAKNPLPGSITEKRKLVPLSKRPGFARRVWQNPLALSGITALLTASMLLIGFLAFGQRVFGNIQATPTPPALPPNAAYVQFIRGEGRVTYVTNRMTRPENLAQDTFVNSGIGSLIRTEGQAAVKLFLTQTLIVWLGPGSELEIRELASTQTGSSHTEVKLINGIMLTILTANLPAGETFRVIGDPGHVAQVLGSVMGVRYDKNFQTFDVDCLEGHCMNDGEALTDCESAHSESDLIPGPTRFVDQAWYVFVEENKKLTTRCIPTVTPNGLKPTATRTRKPFATVPVPPTEVPLTSTPVPNLTPAPTS